MESIYLGIVLFLFLLAIFDLVVGVSNDAVNFLGSAVGARAASFKWIMGVAAVVSHSAPKRAFRSSTNSHMHGMRCAATSGFAGKRISNATF